MELRRSTREKKTKRFADFFDEELEEEVLTKKTKLTSKGSYLKKDKSFNDSEGRPRRKSSVKKYNLENDSDSDFDVGPLELRKSEKSRRKRGSKPREATKLEFLLDWKREIMLSSIPTNENASKVVTVKKIVDADVSKHGGDLQALFVNITWNTSQNKGGIKIDDFKKLELNKKLMKNGIVFIWSEKEILGKLIHIMEEKGFFYVENFVIALLDASKAESPSISKPTEKETKTILNKVSPSQGMVSPDRSESCSTTESIKQGKDENETEYFLQNLGDYPGLDGGQLLYEGTSSYLKISKRVLMMFRRVDPKDKTLELRHQRTCDALFDLVDPTMPYGVNDTRTKEYIYKLIETLLPKACYNPDEGSLKMMELWADSTRPREGWVNVCEKI